MNLSKPVLLIDCSYFVFYRYYAVKGWYQRAFESELAVGDVMSDENFINTYNSTFEKTVLEFAKKNKVPLGNVMFARDCSREEIWRTKIYPEYKASRDDKATSFNGDIFRHTYNVLFPKLQEKYGFNYIYHNHLEADDLIAVSVEYIRENGLDTKIIIVTNDNDYVQLYKYDVRIVNLQKKDLNERIYDIVDYLQYKIIIGDKSDNIKAIGKKIGDKTAKKMLEDKEVYDKYMSQPGVKEQYELNRLLIDFDYIPEQYKKEAKEAFKEILMRNV